jgi:hypothetical protein
MGLLNKLTQIGTIFGFNGGNPTVDTTAGENTPNIMLEGSQLDLDGQTPPKYSDNLPE